jgi:hypothetical protein
MPASGRWQFWVQRSLAWPEPADINLQVHDSRQLIAAEVHMQVCKQTGPLHILVASLANTSFVVFSAKKLCQTL